MLQFCMNWTPATSIRAAHPSTIRVRATSGVCGSRPGREHRKSTDLSRSYRVGSCLVGEDSSAGSVRLLSRRKIPLRPFSSNFAHRFRKHRKGRRDARVHSRMRKWAYSAQFWCNISPFRINTCKSVPKQRTSTPFRMNTYEKNTGGWGYSSHPETTSNQANLRLLCEPPYAQRLRVILFCLRLPTVNFQLWTVDFLFPCATLSARFGERRMPTREDAWKLLCEYTASESLRKHMLAVEACVRAYARKAGADEKTWSLAALLHDFDYERWPNQEHSPHQGHPSEGAKILREQGYSEEIVRAILSHADYCNVPRQSALEHTLFACDELAGFLTACAYVRPSKSILDLEVDSVKRRMKDKLFAKGVSREDLRKGAEELGVPLEEHIGFCIAALREHADALSLRGSL